MSEEGRGHSIVQKPQEHKLRYIMIPKSDYENSVYVKLSVVHVWYNFHFILIYINHIDDELAVTLRMPTMVK